MTATAIKLEQQWRRRLWERESWSGRGPRPVDIRAAFPLRLSTNAGADDRCFAVGWAQALRIVTNRVFEFRTLTDAAPSPVDVRERVRGWLRAARTTLGASLAALRDPDHRGDDALATLVRRLA